MIPRDECFVDTEYISIACNRSPICADWNSKNVLCFGACNAVSLVNTEVYNTAKITATLLKHTAKVNSVKWIRSLGNTTIKDDDIISGSSDNTAIVWKKTNEVYSPIHQLKEHKGAVTVVDAKYIQQNNETVLYAITASVDSSIKVWRRNNEQEEVLCIQTMDLGNGLCLVLQLSVLPNTSTPILAIGLDDDKVYIFVEKIDNLYEKTFQKVLSLKGHEDWVRGLDFVTIGSKLMLASSSQDTYIRLWSIELYEKKQIVDDKLEIEKELFIANDVSWAVSLDAILSGHEGWVYGVHWNYDNSTKKIKLLSSSIDKSLIIWEPNIVENEEGVWSEAVRVGEVGGSGLGFYGGKFSHDGNAIIGHGYTGSFHLWKFKKETYSWEPSVVCGGHFNEVVDIGWDPDGEFLISASTDQTVRIHSPWVRKETSKLTWHEIARSQIHGFDMSCLAIVSKYCYASGAEEKVIRVFEAPKNFISNFHNITGQSNTTEILDNVNLCQGASVPSLGLSNKAVFNLQKSANEDKHVKDQYPTNYFVPVDMKEPPTEETLMQNTLWPETYKLYGHGYEVFSLAASSDGKILASACKATTPQHASIIIWDTRNWVQKQTLTAHQLTVVQLAFSPDNNMLLSVSRDRRWSVFQKSADETFSLIGCTDKTNGIHTRIIWCCAWTYDSKNFLTGSRDGKVVLWEKGDINSNKSTGPFASSIPPLELKSQSVTAIGTAPNQGKNYYIAAMGLETGIILLYKILHTERSWHFIHSLDNNVAHHLTIKRLIFRPTKETTENKLQLASCSEDHMVKIYNVTIQ